MKPFAIALGAAALAVAVAACGVMPGPASSFQARSGVAASALREAPADYYGAAEGQKGQALLGALGEIVTKHKDLGYDAARDAMFGTVDDLDGDNVIECDYTGRSLSNVSDKNTAYRGGKGFNAEHTWPQSKGAVGPAKSDLHHLFPTDCQANSRRGSYPFGEVESVTWSEGGSSLGLDAQGRRAFEPREDQKGNTARALLYFYMVYGRKADLDNFRVEEATLKRWHQQDPVTAEDRARNDAVYRVQGNRNPFVDRPEFVEAVGTFLARSPKAPGFGAR